MLFELFCYAVTITLFLALAGDARHTSPATVATEAQPAPEPAPIADPAPAMPATIAQPVAVAVVKVATATDYSTLKTPQLRKLCSQRSIVWRNALGQNKHLPKAAMVEALLAS